MRTNIQYDFTSMNEFFNNFITPDDMLIELAELVMNYVLCHDENQSSILKHDVDSLYVLFQEIKHLREQQTA